MSVVKEREAAAGAEVQKTWMPACAVYFSWRRSTSTKQQVAGALTAKVSNHTRVPSMCENSEEEELRRPESQIDEEFLSLPQRDQQGHQGQIDIFVFIISSSRKT